MGRPKAWLPVGSSTMLDVVTRSVRDGLRSASGGVEPPLVVVGAPSQDLPPLAFPVRTVRDEVEGEGPLRGMAAGLEALTGLADAAYVSSCDAPRLAPGFVSLMARRLGDAEIAVPVSGGRHHPLAAVYRVSLLPAIRELLAAGRLRPFFLFERAVTREVDEPALREVDPDLLSLHNVNTPGEYAALVETPPCP
jgi:molybdopterin-guanine dinucleotide biosynthesis protein A